MEQGDIEIPKRLYADLEKLYRSTALYGDQVTHQLDALEKEMTENLRTYFHVKNPLASDLLIEFRHDGIFVLNRQILEADNSEKSLAAVLYQNEIIALCLNRDLQVSDLKSFCQSIHSSLQKASKVEGPPNLTAGLWRNSHPSIRLDFRTSFHRLLKGPEIPEAISVASLWHKRDRHWDLPNGELVLRTESASQPMSSEEFAKLHSVVTQSQNLIQSDYSLLSQGEARLLAIEFGSLDDRHVRYNLFSWTRISLGITSSASSKKSFGDLASSFLDSFNPSFVLVLAEALADFPWHDLQVRIRAEVQLALSQRYHLRSLLEGISIPNRAGIAKRCVELLDQDRYALVADHCIIENDRAGLIFFFELLLAKKLPIEALLIGWGEERLAKALPGLQRVHWDGKEKFIQNLMKSAHAPLVRAASRYLLSLNLSEENAFEIFRKLPTDTQELWVRVFKESPISEHWRPFIHRLAKSAVWVSLPVTARKSLLEVFFKYLKAAAFPILSPWASARILGLWPKFSGMREMILNIVLDLESDEVQASVVELCKQEAKLRFQDPTLRERLRRRTGFKR